MISESPALRAREQQIFAGYTATLAELIAGERGDEGIGPRVEANALMGVHRALVDFARGRILAGARPPRLGREVRAQAERGLRAARAGARRRAAPSPQPKRDRQQPARRDPAGRAHVVPRHPALGE